MGKELAEENVAFVIVNEAGASTYSTSPLGREELPTYDAVLRSAISIGRRLLDPLSELVKINPANIGVGMYQHDVKAKHLRKSLDAVVESCVNYVGVDVNTASPALLRYVSGLNQLTARRLCEYRAQGGPFRSREQLKQVPGFGEATFVQAVGFLKIVHGDNPLDATWIHPESYELAQRVLERAGCRAEDLRGGMAPASRPLPRQGGYGGQPADQLTTAATESGVAGTAEDLSAERPAQETEPCASPAEAPACDASSAVASGQQPVVPVDEVPPDSLPQDATAADAAPDERAVLRLRVLSDKVRQLDVPALAREWSVSEILLQDILNSLARPGRDPREDLPAPVFRHGIVKLEDLEPGMRLSGTVLNVVDFGVFVDIGLSDSGLVHISRLADRFVRDPHEVVGVGDVLTVWVVEIDKQRRRVSLTAIEPGTEKTADARRKPARSQPPKPGGKRPRRPRQGGAEPAAQAPERAARGKPGPGSRPPRKPKFVKPITKAMEEGKEPLRSFSDLMQFYQKKQHDQNESSS
jgi:uncharacterized protein